MNEPQPDPGGVGPELILVRRIAPRAIESRTGRIKAIAFNLRPAKGETALSFYDARYVLHGELLRGAPGDGWSVASVAASALLELGFAVRFEEDEADELPGKHHISANPPAYDDEGQIPLEVRVAIATAATVVAEQVHDSAVRLARFAQAMLEGTAANALVGEALAEIDWLVSASTARLRAFGGVRTIRQRDAVGSFFSAKARSPADALERGARRLETASGEYRAGAQLIGDSTTALSGYDVLVAEALEVARVAELIADAAAGMADSADSLAGSIRATKPTATRIAVALRRIVVLERNMADAADEHLPNEREWRDRLKSR